jgi:hypothetical protein
MRAIALLGLFAVVCVVAILAARARIASLRVPAFLGAQVESQRVLDGHTRRLRTGDLVLCSHEVHAPRFRRILGAAGLELASFGTLHVGVLWVHPQLGPCVVEAVNGTAVDATSQWEPVAATTTCTDCAYDALTGAAFVRGVRVVPWDRFLACYAGTVALRQLLPDVSVDSAALERVLYAWALKQPFSRDFDTKTSARYVGGAAAILFGTTLGLADDDALDEDGVICSDVVAVLLSAAGVWDVGRASSPAAQQLARRALATHAPARHDILAENVASFVFKPPFVQQQPLDIQEHVPRHFTSRGRWFARTFWSEEHIVKRVRQA